MASGLKLYIFRESLKPFEFMLRDFLIVGLGGAIGSMLRFGVSLFMKPFHLIPIATLSVNCIGSFLIGILAGMTPACAC